MFILSMPIAEKMLRPIVVYIFLVLLLRVFGKRELAQLNPFDLVVLLSLSNTVQNAIIGDDNSVAGGLIGAFTLLFVNYIVIRFFFRHRRAGRGGTGGGVPSPCVNLLPPLFFPPPPPPRQVLGGNAAVPGARRKA